MAARAAASEGAAAQKADAARSAREGLHRRLNRGKRNGLRGRGRYN